MAELPFLELGVTGAELAEAIEREADRRDLAAAEFARALSRYPNKWLSQLRLADCPKRETVDRVNALLAGKSVPPPPPNNFQKNGDRKPAFHRSQGASTMEKLPPPVDRDPCGRCGVRADVGCAHRPASGTAPVTFAGEDDGRCQARPGNGHNFHRRRDDRRSLAAGAPP